MLGRAVTSGIRAQERLSSPNLEGQSRLKPIWIEQVPNLLLNGWVFPLLRSEFGANSQLSGVELSHPGSPKPEWFCFSWLLTW